MLLRDIVYPSKSSTIRLLVILTIAIIVTACLIILPGPGSEISSFYSNWTINASAVTAATLSFLTTITAHRIYKSASTDNSKDKIGSNDEIDFMQSGNNMNTGKFHFYICLSLTLGLLPWTSAELGWTYYQLGLGIENPFPSFADGFWLAGYAGFILFAYNMNSALSKSRFYDRGAIILVSISAGLSLGYVINLTYGVANILSSAENELGWLIGILYPILDTIILVPCLLIIASVPGGRNKTNSIHWLLLTGSIILVTLADIGFDYSEVIGVSDEQEWFWDILYAASYIVMAGALYSYYLTLSRDYILSRKPHAAV
jgi:hypothetical protein